MTLKEWKKAQGVTYRYIIRRLSDIGVDVGRVHLCNVFRGKYVPNVRLLIALKSITGLSDSEVLSHFDLPGGGNGNQ
jgi:hypothetical protein